MFHLPKNIRGKLFVNIAVILIFSLTIFSQENEDEPAPIFSVCGKYATNIDSNRMIASDNEKLIFLPTFSGKLTAINFIRLEKEWESDLGGEIISNIIATGENVFVATRISQKIDSATKQKTFLHALDKNTGITQWQKEIETAQDIYLNSFENHLIVIDGYGKILSFSRMSGVKDWEQNLSSTVSSVPHKFRDVLVTGSADRKIIFVSLQSGQITKAFALDYIPTVIVSDYATGTIFTGDDKGAVRSINISDKNRNWIFKRGAKISSIQLTDDGLLVTSLDNFIYLIKKKTGELIWKRRMSGRIVSVPNVTTQYIISASFEDTNALIINPVNGKLLNKISLEPGDFFTGIFLKLRKTFAFTTKSGVFTISDVPCEK